MRKPAKNNYNIILNIQQLLEPLKNPVPRTDQLYKI